MRDYEKVIEATNLRTKFSMYAEHYEKIIDYRVEFTNDSCKRISDLMDYVDLHYDIIEDLDWIINFYKEDGFVTRKEVFQMAKHAMHLIITSMRLRIYEFVYRIN